MNLEMLTRDVPKGETTRDAIIYILSHKWPLSAREIYIKLKKTNSGRSVSYQAVHKTLISMEMAGVLKRDGKSYIINKEWIERIEKFISILKESYSNNRDSSGIGKGQLVFHTLAEVDTFLADFAEKAITGMGLKNPMLCLHWRHFWIPIFLDKRIYKKMAEFINNMKYYAITPSDTPVDRWCQEFWSRNNIKTLCGVGDSGVSDYAVLGDFVMQIFYPKGLMERMDNIFASAKDIHDLDTKELFENLFEKRTTIPVTIVENPELAEQLRERILSYFKKT